MPLVQHYNLVVVNRIVCDMSEKNLQSGKINFFPVLLRLRKTDSTL
jgi:hypothetical protein